MTLNVITKQRLEALYHVIVTHNLLRIVTHNLLRNYMCVVIDCYLVLITYIAQRGELATD